MEHDPQLIEEAFEILNNLWIERSNNGKKSYRFMYRGEANNVVLLSEKGNPKYEEVPFNVREIKKTEQDFKLILFTNVGLMKINILSPTAINVKIETRDSDYVTFLR